jgi:ceramide glucosyltransferase
MIALVVYGIILGAKAALTWRYISQYPKPRVDIESQPVTVCQAILSGDPDLEDALLSTLVALPRARFVWLIDEDDAEAARITAHLRQLHEEREIIVQALPAPPDGINPKLFKLEAARRWVQAGTFVVLDDDTRLKPESLAALLEALERCELATGLPFYRDSPYLYGRLLGQFVNNNSALTYLPLAGFVPPVSINGMCYALKLSTLSQIRGFEPILGHLTDDLAVADRVRSNGGKIVQTPYPQEVATTIDCFARYIAQMHRWYVFALLLMRRQGPAMNVLILALYGVQPLLLAIAITEAFLFPSVGQTIAVFGVLLFRAGILASLQWRFSGSIRHRPFLSILSELVQSLHLGHALLVKTIRWRSRHYRVYDNDRFTSV